MSRGKRFESARRLSFFDYFAAALPGGKPIAYILQRAPSTSVNKGKKERNGSTHPT
jgi:hypothetical protein